MSGPDRADTGEKRRTSVERLDRLILLGLVLSGALAALAFGRDFGASWDENVTQVYGQRTLEAYAGLPRQDYSTLSSYGPFYHALSELVARAVSTTLPGWSMVEGRHLAYFLSFLVATLSVYVIARGLVNPAPALASSLLFATQPLLFGHAFINPKDMPFMGLFAASVAFGMAVVRRLPIGGSTWPSREFQITWNAARKRFRRAWVIGAGVLLSLVLALLSLRRSHLALGGPLPTVLSLGILIALAAFAVWVFYPFLPTWRGRLLHLGAAGGVAGLATAVRVGGPVAGVFVCILLWRRMRRHAWLLAAAYLAGLAVCAYLAWPFLWGGPVAAIEEAVQTMSRFPWTDYVLFRGQVLLAADLPSDFAATHFLLQLTVPAILLGAWGGVAGLFGSRPRAGRDEVVILWAWLLLPFVAAAAQRSLLFDGARHLLFTLTPLFVFSAISFQGIFAHARSHAVRFAVVALALAPGLVAVARLHPYPYIYYNEFAGGVAGAYREYELDYWATSYREAMMALGGLAPHGATIGVAGPWWSAALYARPDMTVLGNEGLQGPPDFYIVTTRTNLDRQEWPGAQVIYEIQREGATLARVLDLREYGEE